MQLTNINGEYELLLPEHRAAREQWDIRNGGWEAARINEMVKAIKPGQIVFDIGTEEGDISALLVKYTECKMVLFEPNDRVWPCITSIWKANNLPAPLDFFRGFLSDKTTEGYHHQIDPSLKFGQMIADHGFKQLYENYPDVPQITLDQYCEETGIYPDVITMDVEGSEGKVLRGAEMLLRVKKPIIFCSIHPEFMYIHYNEWVTPFLRFVDECGYTHRCIEYDYHELHMVFEPKK